MFFAFFVTNIKDIQLRMALCSSCFYQLLSYPFKFIFIFSYVDANLSKSEATHFCKNLL